MFLAAKEVILQLHGVHSFCLNTEKAFQEELARCHICGTSASNTQVALGKTWLAFKKHPQKIFLYLFYIFYIYVSYFYILPYHTPNVFISSFLFTLLLSFSFFFCPCGPPALSSWVQWLQVCVPSGFTVVFIIVRHCFALCYTIAICLEASWCSPFLILYTCYKCRFLGLTGLLNQNKQFKGISKWFVCTCKFEKC